MAISEQSRKHMYQRLEEVLGDDDAATLMEHLPPTGWADVATKQDLAYLAADMNRRFDEVDRRFADIDRRFGDIDRRFGELDDKFLLKWEFYRMVAAQTVALVAFMTALAFRG